MAAHLNKYWYVWASTGAIARHSLANGNVYNTVFDLFIKLNLHIYTSKFMISYVIPLLFVLLNLKSVGRRGKTGWSAVLEFFELFLNCKWFLKNT